MPLKSTIADHEYKNLTPLSPFPKGKGASPLPLAQHP